MTEKLQKQIEFRTKNEKQLLAASYWIDDETEELVYGGAKYGGKSYFGVAMIFGDAHIYPGTHYFIAREELGDLRKFTIPSIQEVHQHWGLKMDDYMSFNGQDNVYNLFNGSRVYLIACKELPSDLLYERFGSMQMTRGWIEEGGQIAHAAKRNLYLSVGRWNNEKYNLKKKLLITCNPKKGWLKWEYIDLWLEGKLPLSKKFVQAFATDNTHGNKDYIESLKNEPDKVTRQRLWDGNWEYDENKKALFRYNALTDLFSNSITKSNEKYLSVDIADDGTDKTIFTFWNDLELYRVEKFARLNTEGIISQIREYAAQERIPYSQIVVDAIGVGAGVASSSLLNGIIGYKSSYGAIKTDASPVLLPNVHYIKDAPLVTDYANLRVQCLFTLANLINDHKVSVKEIGIKGELIEELSLYQDETKTDDKKRVCTSKEDVKALLPDQRSPDLSDCLIQRMYFVVREIMLPDQSQENQKIHDELKFQFDRTEAKMDMNSSR